MRGLSASRMRHGVSLATCSAIRPWSRTVATTSASKKTFDGIEIPAKLEPLFTPLKVGRFELEHRAVMAPLTRCRAIGTVPHPNAAIYYGSRATKGGLVIAEATAVSRESYGYPETPGVHTAEQINGWKPVTKAVHDKGAVFFCQIWHVGRASHQDYQPNGALPVSASPIAITEKWGGVYTPKGGPFPYPVPRALELHEIPGIVKQFGSAARNCLEAGFDGVEVHGANGYLLDQFLKDGSNKRTDAYGGSIENHCRLMLEAVGAVVEAVGADRTGIRLGPFAAFLDNDDSDPYALTTYLIKELNKMNLAYVHIIEPRIKNNDVAATQDTTKPFRDVCSTVFLSAGGYHRDDAVAAISSGHADLVAFGRPFLANPDLLKRFLLDYPLNKYDRSTFYTQDPVKGYIDYPTMEQLEAKTVKV